MRDRKVEDRANATSSALLSGGSVLGTPSNQGFGLNYKKEVGSSFDLPNVEFIDSMCLC